ncbi:hypothetical protein I6B53_06380 [Schaalia sp. 19OD2882]|uniref:zinc ribbon domain-containing protein n=1 Tax=Schaalia sp. 19OD2882 TaxID=2794089 RepID=UPI001C1EDFD5|nr:hypothetical protein [Schaalia sp. 19OD2882]QWW18786.1 hypothetical protein I6B53_06380 [Schaalia sp. 19OD2882]
MKAAPEDQLLLLDLRALDARESQLRHQRDSHPAHGIVRELAGRAEDLSRAAISQSAVIHDVEREATRVEDEIEKVRARRERQQGRVDRNEVPLRDISAMLREIEQMDARLSKLENDALDAEERLEAARGAREAMLREAEAIKADVEKAKAQFLADVATGDEELRAVIVQRRELAGRIGEALMAEYDRAVARNGALAVVEVRDGVVQAMAADLSPAELDAIRRVPADQLCWTEDTQQLVVRTSTQ